jgi:DNA-binding MarR family transcriptional regulator
VPNHPSNPSSNDVRKRPPNRTGDDPQRAAAVAQLLEFFYPVHYQIGTSLEDVFREGALTRKQFAILWLIHSAGDGGRRMRRKEIEAKLRQWFEVSSPAVSQALSGMAKPPLRLIDLAIDPTSGRERVVTLTAEGEAFVAATSRRAERFIAELLAEAPVALLQQAAEYFRILSEGFERVSARRGDTDAG